DGHRIVSGSLDSTARVWDATPLLDGILQAQEAQYEQKRSELKALTERSEAEQYANGKNTPSQQGQWDQVAVTFGNMVEGDPDNLQTRCLHIVSLVKGGNRAGLEKACEELLKRFGNATDPVQANGVAWYCVLAPHAVSDREAPVRLAMAALAGQPER